MSFRLVPNLVTSDDLDGRNSPNRRVISPNPVAFGANSLSLKFVSDGRYGHVLSALREVW